MYPISDTVKALFEAEHRQVLRITGTDSNGNAISITDANVMMDGFEIDRTCCAGEKLEIGNAIASELTLKLDNRQNQFSNIGFEGAELFVEIGIADLTQTNPTVYWIPCGYFTCYEQPRTLNTITIHALDRMMRFDVEPTNLLAPWTDENGTPIEDGRGNIIYFQFDVKLPLTIQKIVAMVADGCGVPFDQDISGLPNANMQITSMPTLQQTITCRSFIQWCAGIMGTNAWIDWDGKLQFTRYNIATDYEMWPANRFSSDLHENDIVIKGISYTNTQDITIVSGDSDYRLDLTGNYLAAYNIAEILSNLRTAGFDFYSYRPFTAEVIPAPYLWPMDKVVFMRERPNQPNVWDDIDCVLTNVNIKLNGTTVLESKGMTAEANSGVKQSGLTTEQAFAVEKATQVTKDLDESLNQEGIFNRLTNDGTAQGIYMMNGQVYVNMSYARSGTLVLGGLNNTNGLLKVLDANGNEIGHWGNDGIVLNQGIINGPLITLGNNNEASGTLTVFDENGDEIGTINSSATKFRIGSTLYDNSGYATFDNQGFILDFGNQDVVFKTDSARYNGTFGMPDLTVKLLARQGNILNNEYWESAIMPGGVYAHHVLNSSRHGWSIYPNYLSGSRATHTFYVDLINGTMSFTGSKSRVVSTAQYSDRLLYCYETPTPMFGDVGEGTVGEDGKCYVWIDPVFAQTITTLQYQVFLQRYGRGECYVTERNGWYFVVEGTPGLSFGWEIKAKQRDYDQLRLDHNGEKFVPPVQTFGNDAAKYVEEIKKGRISA